jgi:hypothetical protein
MGKFFGTLILSILVVTITKGQVGSPSPVATAISSTSVSLTQPSPSTTPANSARFESLRRSFEQLPPDQQQRVIQTLRTGQSPTPSPATATPSGPTVPSSGSAAATARFEAFRKSFEQLPPDQQQRFMQNLHRWQDLSPEERDLLRQRERIRRQKQEKSIDEAYQKSGLQLNEEQRSTFRKRYLQERQRLEEQLLRETQEKRQAGNLAIIEQLKKEFSVSKATPH